AAAAPAGINPTSSAPATSTPRACASRSTAATMSCSAAASQSSTFMLTCAWPALGKSRPSARTPGKPPPRSRITAAISRAATTFAPTRLTLNAMRGRRAARRDLAGVDPALQLLRPAGAEERRPAAPADLAVEEHRQLQLVPDPLGELERCPLGPRHVVGADRNDRHDVGRA